MTVQILTGDCRDVLATLPDASVHCCVSSPPYFGLRDYGTAAWEGGDEGCPHEPPQEWIDHNFNANSAFGEGAKTQGAAAKGRWYRPDGSCRCGATRIDRQMGLEPTPDDFVAVMVAVFREVRRVLRDDGTLWLNIGDSYCASPPGRAGPGETSSLNGIGSTKYRATLEAGHGGTRDKSKLAGLKQKDLIGIPWMLAFALRADGWYLRQDIIWSKPNPMPESVRDRCTKAHEYLFLLSKSPRYYYDDDAIREPWTCDRDDMRTKGVRTGLAYLQTDVAIPSNHVKSKKPDGWATHSGGHGSFHKEGREQGAAAELDPAKGRNKRSVWEVTTQPFSEAHFATFPPDLIEPCILAGCPVGGTVLDPFGGAGTTGLVADRLQRNAILIELNPEYAAMARRRIDSDRGGLLDAMEAA